MKTKNLRELLEDLSDFMDQVQSPTTPAIYLKREILEFLNQNIYQEVSFKDEEPKDGQGFSDGVYGWVYHNRQVKCMHSGTVQPEVKSWIKRV